MVIHVGWVYCTTNVIHQEEQCNHDTEWSVDHWTDTQYPVNYRTCFLSCHLISLWTASTPVLRSAPLPPHNHNLNSMQCSMIDLSIGCHHCSRCMARKVESGMLIAVACWPLLYWAVFVCELVCGSFVC